MLSQARCAISDLAEHQFFASCSFTNARYTFDHLTAQMSLIELVGEPANVKNARRNQHELPIDRCESRDCAVPRKDRLMRSFNLLPDARPFSLPRRRSGKNALKGFRRRGAIAWFNPMTLLLIDLVTLGADLDSTPRTILLAV